MSNLLGSAGNDSSEFKSGLAGGHSSTPSSKLEFEHEENSYTLDANLRDLVSKKFNRRSAL
jgi:hypothetical protein